MQVADTAGAPSDGRPRDERKLIANITLYDKEFESAVRSMSDDLSPAFAKMLSLQRSSFRLDDNPCPIYRIQGNKILIF